MKNIIPKPPDGVIDLDTAIQYMVTYAIPKNHQEIMKSMNVDEILRDYHMAGGMAMRNSWCLWWHECEFTENGVWPKEKPALIKWFNDRGIVHADDISSIISESTVKTIKSIPIDFEQQCEKYFKHWEEQGFEDGVFKYNKK